MKKIVAIAGMIALAAVVFANGARETKTVEGKLAIVDSIPTITVGAESWALPPGPFYQVAWENGLKDGDTLKVEGFVFDGPRDDDEKPMIMPTKAWANGKALDLSNANMRGPGSRRDRRDWNGRCDRGDRGGRGDCSNRRENRKSGAGKN